MDIIADGPTLVLTGGLDGRAAGEVRAAIHDHLTLHDGPVVIDVTQVESMDVTALRVIAAASCRADRQVTLRGASGAVRRLLHLTRWHRFVRIERPHVSA